MELYNIYHTIKDTGSAEYSPYANETVDKYMDEALASSNLEESMTISGKKPSGTGTTGIHRKGIFRGSGCAILIIFILYVTV